MYQQGKWTYIPSVRQSGDSWIWGVDKKPTGARTGPGNTVREGTASTKEEANEAAQKAVQEILTSGKD
jgi:hypothetical protein